jgi:hypothetical protein
MASELGFDHKVRSVRNVWTHASVAFRGGVYTAKVPSHGVLMLRVSEKNRALCHECALDYGRPIELSSGSLGAMIGFS